jgi:hypothetical protein
MPPSRKPRQPILENARLLYESELASDYFQLEGLDAQQQVLDSAVQSYERSVELTQDRFQGGVASMGDVAQAQTQLETARAQLTDTGIARAEFEHAIAVLTGRAPAELSIPTSTTQTTPPVLSVGIRRRCSSGDPTSPPPNGASLRRTCRSACEIGVLSDTHLRWQRRLSGDRDCRSLHDTDAHLVARRAARRDDLRWREAARTGPAQ